MLSLCMFITLLSKAQSCTYDMEIKDPISGEEVKKIAIRIKYTQFMFIKEGSKHKIDLALSISSELHDSVTIHDTLYIKTSSGKILKLTPTKSAMPATSTYGSSGHVSTSSAYMISYIITPEQLNQISLDGGIVFARISFAGNSVDLPFPKGDTKKTSKAASCIL